MRTVIAFLLFALLPATAQELKFPSSFDKLAAKAVETVNITLDASMLQMAGSFLAGKEPQQEKIKKLISGLKGIYVKSFEFAKEGEYSKADVEAIESQLKGPGWSQIVDVKSKKEGETAGIYVKKDDGQIVGMTILSAEPKELTVVNIVGPIDLNDLASLGGHFGIPTVPDVSMKHGAKQDKKAEPK